MHLIPWLDRLEDGVCHRGLHREGIKGKEVVVMAMMVAVVGPPPTIPSFAPSGSQGSNTPATTQGSSSGPVQGANGGSTTPIPSFSPSGGNDGGSQRSTPGTAPEYAFRTR